MVLGIYITVTGTIVTSEVVLGIYITVTGTIVTSEVVLGIYITVTGTIVTSEVVCNNPDRDLFYDTEFRFLDRSLLVYF